MTHLSEKQARALGLILTPGAGKQSKPKPKESDIQRNIKEYLQWNGWFVVKIHQSLGSYKGIADLYALKGGRHVWIEVKTPVGRQSDDQVKFELDIRAAGGEYFLCRSVDDLEVLLNETNPA